MTESEAIEKLKNMRLFMQIEDENNDCKFTEDDYKANEMAIQALEKQISMKPTEINDECGYFECPTCGDLIYAEGARFKEHKYCLPCGRKLDCSDEE